jgi:hypothetical protein
VACLEAGEAVAVGEGTGEELVGRGQLHMHLQPNDGLVARRRHRGHDDDAIDVAATPTPSQQRWHDAGARQRTATTMAWRLAMAEAVQLDAEDPAARALMRIHAQTDGRA